MKLKLIRFKWLFVWLYLLPWTSMAQNLIVNGNFETAAPIDLCNTTPGGWQSSSVQWTLMSEPSHWVDLTNCGFGNGRWIEQTVPTTNGRNYSLTFQVGAPQYYYGGVDVYINGAYFGNFAQPNNFGFTLNWGTFNTNFTANACQTVIRFVGASPNGGSAINVNGLDNVTLYDIGQGTPTYPPYVRPIELELSRLCLPMVITATPYVGGSRWWYKDNVLINTGSFSINATTPGTYKFVSVNPCGDTMITDTVITNDCPDCDPIFVPTAIRCQNFEVDFDITLYGDSCDKCWGSTFLYFGDLDTSSVPPVPGTQPVTHQYPGPGTYTAYFYIYNKCIGTTQYVERTFTIDSCPPCPIEVDTLIRCAGKRSEFDYTMDTSCVGCYPGGLVATYGDGNSDTIVAGNMGGVSHVYSTPGTYTFQLCGYNVCRGTYYCKTMTIVVVKCPDECVPDISIKKFCKSEPTEFEVIFPEACKGCIKKNLQIDYGDNTSGTSSGIMSHSFTHQYVSEGTYTVKFCWTNTCTGKKECTSRTFVITKDCDTCMPTALIDQLCAGEITNFSFDFPEECGECLTTINIRYGDGTSETGLPGQVDFHHQFPGPGVYTVKACWINCQGVEKCIIRKVVINDCNDPCMPEIETTGNCINDPINVLVEFPAMCHHCIGAYTIHFGDGNSGSGSGTSLNIPHTYTTTGTYVVQFCWTDLCNGQQKCAWRLITVVDCSVQFKTGVNENTGDILSLYPNPAEATFTIEGINEAATITVYDLSGKAVLVKQAGAENTEVVDIRTLAPGAYIVRVVGTKQTSEFKLIKK